MKAYQLFFDDSLFIFLMLLYNSNISIDNLVCHCRYRAPQICHLRCHFSSCDAIPELLLAHVAGLRSCCSSGRPELPAKAHQSPTWAPPQRSLAQSSFVASWSSYYRKFK
jgi:hypothetical protein